MPAKKKTSAETSRFITVPEILEELDIGRSTWDRWMKKGNVPILTKLPGGHIRIRRTDYDRWLESREVQPVNLTKGRAA